MAFVRRTTLAGLSWLALMGAAQAEAPRFTFPADCELGRTCFVQNHVDHDPSPEARDFACGTLTYDGHNGTDIRVPTLRAQQAGVDVLAAADGRVARRRDGVPDVSVRTAGRAAVQGAECGNGVVIDHGNGWETQYCHMAQGSLRVRPGDPVKAGQPLGRIGLSGLTEYPHLHFTARLQGQIVDPFAFEAPPGTCSAGKSLWDKIPPALAYQPGAVLNAGFAPGPVTMEAIESGDAALATPGPDSPALVAYVRAIGLKAGDVQKLTLTDPAGRVLAESPGQALDRPKAQVMLFTGVRKPAAGWASGRYRARYTVLRGEKIVLEKDLELTM